MLSKWWQMHWLFNRRTGVMLAWAFLLFAIAIIVNLLGIRLAGSVESWLQWMKDHAKFFVLWRLLLYGLTIYGWLWMRQRLLAREPGNLTRQRIRRAEISGLLAVILLETSQFLTLG